jgi:hypothetical protein
MAIYAIINGTNVVNIIEYATQPSQPIPGLDPNYFAVLTTTAGPGWTYANGIFTAPQPYPSWTLVNNIWTAPIPYPTDGKFYIWNETTKIWS